MSTEIRVAAWLPNEWGREPTANEQSAIFDSDPDILLIPEEHDAWENREKWRDIAEECETAIYAGFETEEGWNIGYYFDPATGRKRVYRKHSTADRLAFERDEWSPASLNPIQYDDAKLGLTVCHDHYFSPLMGLQADRGADLLLNLSATPVKRRKWGEILQSRAIENGSYTFCTMHGLERDGSEPAANQAHVFAFSPTGEPLTGHDIESGAEVELFDTSPPGIYLFDCDAGAATDDSTPVESDDHIERVRRNDGTQQETDSTITVHREEKDRFTIAGQSDRCRITPGTNEALIDGEKLQFIHLDIEDVMEPDLIYRHLLPADETGSTPVIHITGEGVSDAVYTSVYEPVIRARVVEWCAPIIVNTNCRFAGYQIANTAKDTHKLDSEGDSFRFELSRAWGISSALKPVDGHQEPLVDVCEGITERH